MLLGKNLRTYGMYIYYIMYTLHLAFVQIEDKDNVYVVRTMYKRHVRMCVRDVRYTSLCVCYYLFYFLFAQLLATHYPIVLASRIARGPGLYSYP